MTELEEILASGLYQLIADIIAASEAHGQRASGRTYDLITQEVERIGELVSGAVYAPDYFYTLIRGRGPGKAPANMAEIIMEWAGYKGISFNDPKDFARWANAVAWKIRREGSQMFRRGEYNDIIETPIKQFEEWLSAMIDKYMSVQITQAIFPDEQVSYNI